MVLRAGGDEEVLEANLSFHLHAGIDGIVVLDASGEGSASALLKRLPPGDRVRIAPQMIATASRSGICPLGRSRASGRLADRVGVERVLVAACGLVPRRSDRGAVRIQRGSGCRSNAPADHNRWAVRGAVHNAAVATSGPPSIRAGGQIAALPCVPRPPLATRPVSTRSGATTRSRCSGWWRRKLLERPMKRRDGRSISVLS